MRLAFFNKEADPGEPGRLLSEAAGYCRGRPSHVGFHTDLVGILTRKP